jgi:hypothetical protein
VYTPILAGYDPALRTPLRKLTLIQRMLSGGRREASGKMSKQAVGVRLPFDKPFENLTAVSKAEPLTALRQIEGQAVAKPQTKKGPEGSRRPDSDREGQVPGCRPWGRPEDSAHHRGAKAPRTADYERHGKRETVLRLSIGGQV